MSTVLMIQTKERNRMKKSILSATAIAMTLSASAFAGTNLPYEQTQFDRGLPITPEWARSRDDDRGPGSAAGATSRAESGEVRQNEADRKAARERESDRARSDFRGGPQLIPDPYTPQ